MYITFENIYPNTQTGVDLGLKRWLAFQAAQGKDEAAVKAHRKRFNTAYFPITVEEHIALLKQCGFRIVEVLWFSHMQAGFYGIK